MAEDTTTSDVDVEIQKIWEHVSPEPMSGCWLWTKAITRGGYGVTQRQSGKLGYVHRIAYEAHKGPIPAELNIDHKCRVRCCCNPDHLEAVTPKENTRRGEAVERLKAWAAAKTHFDCGHEINEGNTYRYRGGRYCKPCRVARTKQWRSKNVH